jgi:hypothetical protein
MSRQRKRKRKYLPARCQICHSAFDLDSPIPGLVLLPDGRGVCQSCWKEWAQCRHREMTADARPWFAEDTPTWEGPSPIVADTRHMADELPENDHPDRAPDDPKRSIILTVDYAHPATRRFIDAAMRCGLGDTFGPKMMERILLRLHVLTGKDTTATDQMTEDEAADVLLRDWRDGSPPHPAGDADLPRPAATAADGVAGHVAPEVWGELLTSPPLTAKQIADKLGQPVGLVERTLRYWRKAYDYGFIKDDDAGVGEARFRYKMSDTIAHLQKWVAKRQRKAAREQPD